MCKSNISKAKFFSLYWGQRLVCTAMDEPITVGAYGFVNELTLSESYINGFNGSCLELSSLSQLTVEHANEVTRLKVLADGYDMDDIVSITSTVNVDPKVEHRAYISSILKTKRWADEQIHTLLNRNIKTHHSDYLRSVGYAILYKEIPIEEFIERGWAKIRKQ